LNSGQITAHNALTFVLQAFDSCSISRVREKHVKRIGGIWESSHLLAWNLTNEAVYLVKGSPTARRCRFIAHTADLSAFRGFYDIPPI
jgi:hypothetical protein